MRNAHLFYRSFELDRAKVDEEKRTTEVAFSSEQPVRRWFGNEILLHGAQNVDLSRLRAIGSALMNHDPGRIIGRTKNVRVEDKLGRATIVFDDDDDGNCAFGKVRSGSLRGVSVGYMIEKARKVKEDEEYEGIRGPALIALRWTPYEISLTPIPADASVGVGRDLTRSLDGIDIIHQHTITQEERTMNEQEIRELFAKLFAEASPTIVEAVRAKLAEDAKPKLRITPEQAADFIGRAGAISPEAKSRIADMILVECRTEQEITKMLLDLAMNKADARDTGNGPGSDGTGTDASAQRTQRGTIRSFQEIEDADFFRGLKNPSAFALQ